MSGYVSAIITLLWDVIAIRTYISFNRKTNQALRIYGFEIKGILQDW